MIKPILTEQDLTTVLDEINTIMDAQPGTPEGDRLEILLVLVETYENSSEEHLQVISDLKNCLRVITSWAGIPESLVRWINDTVLKKDTP
jgi:antitoxin component HigA of HigAB toxin-antitoxin module